MQQLLDMLHPLHVSRLVRRAGNLPYGRFLRPMERGMGQITVFTQAELGKAIVQMVKNNHGAGQHQAGFCGRSRNGLRQPGLEQSGGNSRTEPA